jgi:hypothetical protein
MNLTVFGLVLMIVGFGIAGIVRAVQSFADKKKN